MKRIDAIGIFLCGLLLGVPVGVHMLDSSKNVVDRMNLLTLQQAQRILEDHMREVCKPWFRSKNTRIKGDTIVACTAPDFMIE